MLSIFSKNDLIDKTGEYKLVLLTLYSPYELVDGVFNMQIPT